MAGEHTVGVYPLLEDDTCHFLAVDFDEAEWQQDARAFMQSCAELGVPAALEISRSGRGAHVWVFFAGRLSARDARRLGRLAAFQNPEFYKAQAMRLSVWDKPRVIGNAENYPQHIALPRGCLDAALALLKANGIRCSAGQSGTQPPSRPVHHTIWWCCGDHGFRALTC